MCDNVWWLQSAWLMFSVGGQLLPGHEPDCSHFANVPEWGGRILGPVSAAHQPQACNAWWANLNQPNFVKFRVEVMFFLYIFLLFKMSYFYFVFCYFLLFYCMTRLSFTKLYVIYILVFHDDSQDSSSLAFPSYSGSRLTMTKYSLNSFQNSRGTWYDFLTPVHLMDMNCESTDFFHTFLFLVSLLCRKRSRWPRVYTQPNGSCSVSLTE